MDIETQNILQKTAEYIDVTQRQLEQQEDERIKFLKRANQAAGALVTQGILDKRNVDKLVDKIAEDQCHVWDVIEKLASLVGVDELGQSADLQKDAKNLDAWERWVLFGSPDATAADGRMID